MRWSKIIQICVGEICANFQLYVDKSFRKAAKTWGALPNSYTNAKIKPLNKEFWQDTELPALGCFISPLYTQCGNMARSQGC